MYGTSKAGQPKSYKSPLERSEYSMHKQEIDQIIEAKQKLFIDASDQIWDYAETRFEEKQSAELLCNILLAEGFTIEKSLASIETAYRNPIPSEVQPVANPI